MTTVWKIILSIAFAIILLEVMVMLKKGNILQFSWLGIASLASVAAALYYYIFEYKFRKK
ncbi:MAG: hypothetical protein P8I55_07050 [Crocinitomix sp.]|nr:hypothetical protein [Crocinitomix sp.]|tara:strand:- start:157 stop:336 length:180 start_codon:yes stop_codon:yes gene_type:complete